MSTTIQDAIAKGEQRLKAAGIENPRLAVELMLRKLLRFSRIQLHQNSTSVLDPDDAGRLDAMIERKLKREPLQHILGETEWYGLTFRCDKRALVPRPETEIVVETALQKIKAIVNPQVADIGTGSGCIAIAIAAERLDAVVVANDSDSRALKQARENIRDHQLESRIEAVEADLSEFLQARTGFDLIISNPPYIRESEYATLMPEVRDYEPKAALVAGADGLYCIRELIRLAPGCLKAGGWIALEFGIDHAEPARQLMAETGRFENIQIIIDYNNRERGIIAQLK